MCSGPATLLLVPGVLIAYDSLKRPADVHNADVPFKAQKPPRPKAKTVNWPLFGFNPARTRYLAAKGVKPPFRKLWRYTGRPLLEFPPIFVGGKLYFVNNSGRAFALDADTGKVLWERRIGLLNASSPAYYRHRLYIVNLVPGPHRQAGREDRQNDLEAVAAGARRVLAGGDRPHRLLRL